MTDQSMDRTGWGSGPWDNEPDRLQWRDETTGMPCLLVRNRMGALCGYVAVDRTHPWHGKGYDDVDVDVHGGLTFADSCQEGGPICHEPEPGKSADVWWFGFDCLHFGDFPPGLAARERAMGFGDGVWDHTTYKPIAYVQAECASLAGQLAAVKS